MVGKVYQRTAPQPARMYDATGRDLHIDGPLTNQTIAYRPQNLIAPQIFPIVAVGKESGVYYVWDRGTFLTINDAERARGAEANRIGYDVSSDTYIVKNYALAMDLPYEDLANADAALQLRESSAMRVVDALNLAWEDRLAVSLTSSVNVGSCTALGNSWADEVDGDPIEDIYTGIESIRKATGFNPNTMIMGEHAFKRISRHPDIITFIRGQGDNRGGGPVTAQQLASVFPGVQRVLVGGGIKNTAQEGSADPVFTDIWSTACILLHVAPAPGIMVPSFGYTYRWTPAGFPGALAVERYGNQRPKTESVEVHMFQDEKVVAPELGYFIVGT